MRNFTIIIPIYNEIDSIFNLVDEILAEFKSSLPEIIIVDGSTDNFKNKIKTFKKKPFTVFITKKIWENVKLC